jgi:phosphate transport system permease protein
MAKAVVKKRKDVHLGDKVFSKSLLVMALGVVALLFGMIFFIYLRSQLSVHHFGLKFFFSSQWDPVKENYGALPVIYGTVVSSLLAVLIATPLSIGVALFLTELVSKKVASVVGFMVEMLAAIPSVVYGLWGVFVLAPQLRTYVQPWLRDNLGFLPLFQGAPFGVGMMSAGIILAIMIIPTISSIARQVFKSIPRTQREAALALGSTRWEMMKIAVLKSSKSGLFGAVSLGLGRALGETMAVTMLIGNRAEISSSLFAPGQTMASVIANEYAEATSDLHLSALAEVGLALFMVTFVINSAARLIIKRSAHT